MWFRRRGGIGKRTRSSLPALETSSSSPSRRSRSGTDARTAQLRRKPRPVVGTARRPLGQMQSAHPRTGGMVRWSWLSKGGPWAAVVGQPEGADAELVAVAERREVDAVVVEVGAVEAGQVVDQEAVVFAQQLEVSPRDGDVFQADVVFPIAADRDSALVQLNTGCLLPGHGDRSRTRCRVGARPPRRPRPHPTRAAGVVGRGGPGASRWSR